MVPNDRCELPDLRAAFIGTAESLSQPALANEQQDTRLSEKFFMRNSAQQHEPVDHDLSQQVPSTSSALGFAVLAGSVRTRSDGKASIPNRKSAAGRMCAYAGLT